MAVDSVVGLAELLRHCRLLEPQQLDELPALLSHFPEPQALARELARRGWLTPYQVNEIFRGRGPALLLGSYVLLEKLGEGGMGQVFKARNWKLGRVVALKLIRKERLTSDEAVRRFQREIRLAAQCDHPHIVRAHDADEVGGTHLLVMQFVEGASDLNQLVKKSGPLPVPVACEYVRQAALGLQHAHERGLVHRDIKPHNLLVCSRDAAAERVGQRSATASRLHEDVIKLLDLGLARRDLVEGEGSSTTLTRDGAVVGTLDYLAPEQAMNSHAVDIRADLYSLGCTFYYLLTGRVPFPGGEALAKLLKHRLEEPTPIQKLRPVVPEAVIAVVRRLMAKKPEERYQTPAELAAELEQLLEAAASEPRPSGSGATVPMDSSRTLPLNPFADLLASDSGLTAPEQPHPRPVERAPWLLIGAGVLGGALLLGAVFLVLGALSGGRPTQPGAGRPTVTKPARQPTAEEVAAAEKKRQVEAEDAERKRRADSEEAIKPLAAKAADAKTTFVDFAKDVQAFKAKYGGTPAAIKAAELLMKLPSPLDQLDPAKIPDDARTTWSAIGYTPPSELVAVFGTHAWQGVSYEGGGQGLYGIQGIVASPDGKHLAICDRYIRLLDTESGCLVRSFSGKALNLALSADGKTLAAANYNAKDITLSNMATGELLATLEGPNESAWCLAFSPDGKTLACAFGGQIRVWDLVTKEVRFTVEASSSWEAPVAISPESKLLAGLGSTRSIKLWDLATGKPHSVPVLEASVDGLYSLAFSPKGGFLAAAATNGTVTLWDLTTAKETQKWTAVSGDALRFVFSQDGTRLAVGRYNPSLRNLPGDVQIWDVEAKKELARVTMPNQVAGLAFSRDGGTLYGSCWSSVRIWRWDAATGKEVQPLTGAQQNYYGHLGYDHVAFSQDYFILSPSIGLWHADLWATAGGRRLAGLPSQGLISLMPEGSGWLANGEDQVLRFTDLQGKHLRLFGKGTGYGVLSPDARRLLSVHGDGSITLWDAEKGDELLRFQGSAATFSPDAKQILSGGADGTLVLRDRESRREARRVGSVGGAVQTLDYSPNGEFIVAASGQTGYLFDVKSKTEAWRTEIVASSGFGSRTMQVSPDAKFIATCDPKNRVILWETAGRKKLREWQFPIPVQGVAFANDGRHLATANANGTVYILRLADGPPRALSAEEAKKQQEDEAKRLGVPVQLENSMGMKFNLVPSGHFIIGSPERIVTIERPFQCGIHEVTQEQFSKVMGKNPSRITSGDGGGPDHPVDNVTQDEAVQFCQKLSTLAAEKAAGRSYRLPQG